MISIHPPSGLRDFINDDARRRLTLMHLIAEVYQSFGFLPLETPALENLDILLSSGGGEENEKLIFKVLKRGEKLDQALQTVMQSEKPVGSETSPSAGHSNSIADFGLRFDLTVPLSRAVALHRGKIHFPWKVFHIGPVWRAERPQKGRFREFIQCDVDIVGGKGVGAEIEVIQAVTQAIHKAGASGFELKLNDRRLIQAMGQRFGFTESQIDSFAVILDKKDKLPAEELMEQLRSLSGKEVSLELKNILEGKLDLDVAKEFHADAVQDLQSIMTILQSLHLPLQGISFDPSLARGMGYYTGPVFELRHASAGYSFGGGGRYDRLIGRFSGQEIPACGFSLGFERLVLLLEENERQVKTSSRTLFLPVFDESLRQKMVGLAAEVRQAGITVDLYPDRAKIKNQFKFASDSGYRWVLIAGENEWTQGIFKLKDFTSGSEVELPQKTSNTSPNTPEEAWIETLRKYIV